MCGIIGFVGERPCLDLLLDGLARMEYRGYDSAGVSLQSGDRIERVRAVGHLAALRSVLAGRVAAVPAGGVATAEATALATTGIGHTRWATHGSVTQANAHPHADSEERVHVVLNGIVENHVQLRAQLEAAGTVFSSQTDAEVVAHLIAAAYDGDLAAAVIGAAEQLRGEHAFVALCADEPDVLVGARRACPLVVGAGDDGFFIASAVGAFAAHCATAQPVGDGDIVVLTPDGVAFRGHGGERHTPAVERIDAAEQDAGRDGHETFMLKEICEQPAAVARTVAGRIHGTEVALDVPGLDRASLRAVARVRLIGCGTSYHAALVARCAIEEWARLPVEVEIASEYRYRNPVDERDELVVGISQSGETADTLAAMRLARRRGSRVLAVTNVAASQAARDADATLLTHAGTEVGVAATKTFVSQVTALQLLALAFAQSRGTLPLARRAGLADELRRLPDAIERALVTTGPQMHAIAARWAHAGHVVFLGRHVGLPVAMEGALKLKEITYIPSDAYASGEMKHGPIALISERTPVLCVATDSKLIDKLLSNVAEVRARGAHVIAVATEGSDHVAGHVDEVVWVPRTDWLLAPALAVLPLQLFAYHAARLRGLDVDRPRNLAKTVTVE